MIAPDRLYKYESFTAQSLENFKNQAVYFASPTSFNDPYDCAIFPGVKVPSDEDVELIRQHYLKDKELDHGQRNAFERKDVNTLRQMFVGIGQEMLDSAVHSFITERGVSCFSERRDSLLMWGHYGGKFKGFCIEFRTDFDPFAKARKVVYTDAMPKVDIVSMLCDEDNDDVLNLYCTKALDWQYEREWRCLHKKAGTVYTYPTEALTGVFIGPDAPYSTLEIIALVLAGQNPEVQLWQGKRSKSAFTVIFEPVTYTSHIEAKRLGLLPPEGS